MKTSLLLFLLLAQCIIYSEALTSGEKTALYNLRDNTNHDDWTSTQRNGELDDYDTEWTGTSNNAICGQGEQSTDAWFGVICVDSHVEILLLGANNLDGSLIESINRLTYLKQLYLFDNQLSGIIPANFNELTQLTHFYVWDNQLTSVLNIADTPNLEKFYFERNLVTDSNINWIPTLDSIEEIDGSDNQITGTIPLNIQNAANLHKINFDNNRLSGTIPTELLNHPEMIFIYLKGNLLTGAIPSGIDYEGSGLKLAALDFSDNLLSCLVPDWLVQLTIPIDISGNVNFYCPVPLSTYSLTTSPEDCITLTQSGVDIDEFEIWGGSGSITIFGENFDACSTGDFECKFNDQFGSDYMLSVAHTVTPTSISCEFPDFTTGGGKTVCVSQDNGVEITTNCSFIFTYFDCSTLCQNGGFCNKLDGTCVCSLEWTGDTCEEQSCGGCNEANGGGRCATNGTCICNAGWTGTNCGIPNKSCEPFVCVNGECSGYTGECECATGWQGDECDEVYCPPCDPVGGTCVNGTCQCATYYSGILCNYADIPCPGDCGAPTNGQCNQYTGECSCYTGWEGDNCDIKPCPLNCSYPNGHCDTSTGTCTCEGYYQLPTCITQNVPCPNDCSGKGTCNILTGVCKCKYPFQLDDCQWAECNPSDCYGHGTCNITTGVCNCDYPWTGSSCATPNATCPNDCSGVGTCDKSTGLCICPYGYNTTVGDCSLKLCPQEGDCNNNGNCNTTTGLCECDTNYIGATCATIDLDCPDDCNGNGYCNRKTGECKCSVGYDGLTCASRTCNNNCTYPNGTCDTVYGNCYCADGYEGDDCSLLSCPNECLNGGVCDNTRGVCVCASGFRGDTCALQSCPSDCSGKGSCVGGVCFCEGRWTEENCSVEEPDYPLMAFIIALCIIAGITVILIAFMIWRAVMIANLKAQAGAAGGGGGDEEFSMSSQ